MNKTILHALMLAAVLLAAPVAGVAEDAVADEADVAFLKRMITRLKNTERQAGRLEDRFDDLGRQAKISDGTMNNDPLSNRNDRYGSQIRNKTRDRASEYRQAERRMRSTRNDAIDLQQELAELQRSDARLETAEREEIEKTVGRLEKSIEDMNRELQSGRL